MIDTWKELDSHLSTFRRGKACAERMNAEKPSKANKKSVKILTELVERYESIERRWLEWERNEGGGLGTREPRQELAAAA
jgi:hypothetical protein